MRNLLCDDTPELRSPSACTALAATVRSVVLGTCSAISPTAAPATSAGRWPE